MRKAILIMALFSVIGGGANLAQAATDNPFFETWETPFGTPPFDKIEIGHFEPAIIKGMQQHDAEIATIVNKAVNCICYCFSCWDDEEVGCNPNLEKHPCS